MKSKVIIDRGRGPEIAGTRITVFDVLDYLLDGWHHTRIATLFHISSNQVLAAMEYIQKHKVEVIPEYAKILERCARGNPPELRARLKKYHGKVRELLRKQREGNGRNNGGQ